jgi:serine protease inhibitor
MPTNVSLDSYINDVKSSDIDSLINKLKPIELNSFKDGVITHVEGLIPLFDFEYELNLVENLKMLGIQNVFDSGKADLSNLTSGNAYISQAVHKANIEFSNDGIKAGAATALGGAGAAGCRFDYIYDVPVEKIDITFDKPFLFFVMDKETKEVWFAGTVYEPKEENVNEDYLNWD